jgi:hypothetical protein
MLARGLHAVQCRYPRSDWETIALFEREPDAESYASRHTGEGLGVLRTAEFFDDPSGDCFAVSITYGAPTPEAVWYPIGVWFKYRVEALAFARGRLWRGGILGVPTCDEPLCFNPSARGQTAVTVSQNVLP